MVLLEGSIHKLKVDFNTKINDLKLRKVKIIDRVKDLNSRLSTINNDLGTQEDLVLPSIDESVEYPMKIFDVGDQDIENYRALKKKRVEEEEAKKKGGGKKRKKDEEAQKALDLQKAEEEARQKAEASKKQK